jgi:hypothetical protein
MLATIPLIALGTVQPASAQAASRCENLFPGIAWTPIEGGTVDVAFVGIPQGQVDRFTAEIESSAAAIAADIGGLDDASVCLVGKGVDIDMGAYLEPTRRFHAVLDAPNNVLALSAENVSNVKPAAAFGLAHLALWNRSDGAGWPEPLASAIAHWYRAVALDRLTVYHKQAQGADFRVNALTGESSFGLDFSTDPRVDWFASRQVPVRSWDPTNNDIPIGDFIEYTVSVSGKDVLLDVDADAWVVREGEWRTALVADLTGRTTPTTTWRAGVILIVVLLIIATVIAIGGWRSKRKRKSTETPPPMPGLFTPATKD